MSEFTIHDASSAPAESRPLLENSIKAFGMVPNLHGVMAEAPTALASYQFLHDQFLQTSFNADEKTVVWQTINVEHECHYCIPAHSAIAKSMKVDMSLNEALRNRETMPTEKLQVLHETTLTLVRNRGILSEVELQRFLEAGYNHQQLLEIIVGIAQKVMSNYTNHLARTPVDAPFKAFA